jgi:hypothetical protein
MRFLFLFLFEFLHDGLVFTLLSSAGAVSGFLCLFSIYLFADERFDELERPLFQFVLGNKKADLGVYLLHVVDIVDAD